MKKFDTILLSDRAAIVVDTTYWGFRKPFVWISSIKNRGENLTGFGIDLSDIIPGLNEVVSKLEKFQRTIPNFDVNVVRTNYKFTICSAGPMDNRRLCLNLGENNGKPCIINVPGDKPSLFISNVKGLLNYLEKLNGVVGPEYDLSEIERFEVAPELEKIVTGLWFPCTISLLDGLSTQFFLSIIERQTPLFLVL